MKFRLQRILDPESEPLTLAEAKRHLYFVDDDIGSPTVPGPNDDDISALISVAREMVEGYTGRALVDQTWRLAVGDSLSYYDSVSGPTLYGECGSYWQRGGIYLRRSPVIALGSITSIDSEGVATELQDLGSPESPAFLLKDAGTKWPRIVGLPTVVWSGELQIEFRAGFVDLTGSPQQTMELVPAVLKHAMKLIIGHYFENREAVNIGNIVTELPLGVQALLNPHKCDLGFA